VVQDKVYTLSVNLWEPKTSWGTYYLCQVGGIQRHML
jgi:hypothetical protein